MLVFFVVNSTTKITKSTKELKCGFITK